MKKCDVKSVEAEVVLRAEGMLWRYTIGIYDGERHVLREMPQAQALEVLENAGFNQQEAYDLLTEARVRGS